MRTAVAIWVLGAVACGRLDAERVREDFLNAHPTYIVEDIGVGEGDASAAYVHIRFRRPGDPVLREDVWQYLRDARTGQWQLLRKESLPVTRP
jgi:hypothetical protein